jgi:death on curing protein
MGLFSWLVNEEESFRFLDNLLKNESDELDELKNYMRLIHKKLSSILKHDINEVKRFMIVEKSEEKTVFRLNKNISTLIKALAKYRNPLLSKFKRDERKKIILIKSEIKKLKRILIKQINIINQKTINNNDWYLLEELTKNEVKLIYSIEGDSNFILKDTFKITNRFFPEKIKYLTVKEVIAIHDDVIAKWGGLNGIREITLLDSAVNRPKQGSFEGDFYPTIYDKSAALLYSLVYNHPFIDGNKRTSVYAVSEFLKINGIKNIDTKGLFKLTKSLSKHKKTISDLRKEILSLAA